MSRLVRNVLADASGQGLGEYALILGFVSILAIASLTAISGGISNALNAVATAL